MPILYHNTAKNYYPFGMLMPGRTYSSEAYSWGFNGMQKDDEISGEGNNLDFGARIYDSRLGRWLSLDPLQQKYPSLNPYNFVANSPILFIDPDGRIIDISNLTDDQKKQYNTMLTQLSQSELHKYVYQALENSSNTFIIIFDNELKGLGKFSPGSGTITINPNNVSSDVSVLSEEMFHGFQEDRKNVLYPDGVSSQNLEAEGDLYKEYINKQISKPVKVPSKNGGYFELGGYNTNPQDYNYCQEFFNLCEKYEEGNNRLPSNDQMVSESYQSDFSNFTNYRYEFNKNNKELPSSYRTSPSSTVPNTLFKAVKEANSSELAGPKLENGDYYEQ